MNCCAVLDTNVIVASLLSKRSDSAAVQIVRAALRGRITPLYHRAILEEYEEVLHRPKFYLQEKTICRMLEGIRRFGIEVFPKPTGEILIDMDDLIFYEVAMEKRKSGAYLVTGNQKHYPDRDFIVTPAEMMQILQKAKV